MTAASSQDHLVIRDATREKAVGGERGSFSAPPVTVGRHLSFVGNTVRRAEESHTLLDSSGTVFVRNTIVPAETRGISWGVQGLGFFMGGVRVLGAGVDVESERRGIHAPFRISVGQDTRHTATPYTSDMASPAVTSVDRLLLPVLQRLRQAGDLVAFKLGESDGHRVEVFGQVPREELDAYLTVRRQVREALDETPLHVELSLDTDALDD